VRTVRLIRSKGVGIFFITQTPKDLPGDVLAQLGSRVQHQLRAFTPDDAKALRASVTTFPDSPYDLQEVLTTLGTGEAIVTVLSERGAPTPVAWTRLRAPQGSMSPAPASEIDAAVAASPLMAKYGTEIDRDSAREMLARKLEAAERAAAAEEAAEAEREYAEAERAERRREDAEAERRRRSSGSRTSSSGGRSTRRTPPGSGSAGSQLGDILGSPMTRTIVTSVISGIFGTRRRRR